MYLSSVSKKVLDCISFNLAFPKCRALNAFEVGDGLCQEEHNIAECGYDGGDCCHTKVDKEYLGDGRCNAGKLAELLNILNFVSMYFPEFDLIVASDTFFMTLIVFIKQVFTILFPVRMIVVTVWNGEISFHYALTLTFQTFRMECRLKWVMGSAISSVNT